MGYALLPLEGLGEEAGAKFLGGGGGLCQRLHPWVRGENSLQLMVVVMGSEGGQGSCRNAEI